MSPDQHTLYSNRSLTHFNLKEYKAALSDSEKCIELNPNWAKGYHRKAAALAELGEVTQAFDFYGKACFIDPNESILDDMSAFKKRFFDKIIGYLSFSLAA